MLVHGQETHLGAEYNYLVKYARSAIKDTYIGAEKIVHYTSEFKPWTLYSSAVSTAVMLG